MDIAIEYDSVEMVPHEGGEGLKQHLNALAACKHDLGLLLRGLQQIFQLTDYRHCHDVDNQGALLFLQLFYKGILLKKLFLCDALVPEYQPSAAVSAVRGSYS